MNEQYKEVLAKGTETELRNLKIHWPKSREELNTILDILEKREHDYGTCVYAMSIAALSSYYYMASVLGVTGFQASCADLDFIRRTRNMDAGFIIIDFNKLLYPQYDIYNDLHEAIKANIDKLKEKAKEKLKDCEGAHLDVIAHWKKLAGE